MVKKANSPHGHATHGAAALTRRERQIMDILYRRGRATATEVMDDLSGTPNYSTVRTQLRVGKKRRFRFRFGRLPNWKKAIVTLHEEYRIDFY